MLQHGTAPERVEPVEPAVARVVGQRFGCSPALVLALLQQQKPRDKGEDRHCCCRGKANVCNQSSTTMAGVTAAAATATPTAQAAVCPSLHQAAQAGVNSSGSEIVVKLPLWCCSLTCQSMVCQHVCADGGRSGGPVWRFCVISSDGSQHAAAACAAAAIRSAAQPVSSCR